MVHTALSRKNFTLRKFLSALLCFQLLAWPPHVVLAQQQVMQTPGSQARENDAREKARKFTQDVQSLRKIVFGGERARHPLDAYSLLDQEVKRGEKEVRVDFKHILFEVVDERVNFRGLIGRWKSLNERTLPENYHSQYQGTSFIAPNSEHYLRVSYQGVNLHDLPRGVKWAAVVGHYLVFFQPHYSSDKKTVLSFIDLEYFESALGKTELPIFNIPVNFENGITRELLENPSKIIATVEGMEIAGEGEETLEISREQFDFLSRFQQIFFNMTVSFVDVEDLKPTEEYVNEIIRVYQESLEGDQKEVLTSFDPSIQEGLQGLREILQRQTNMRAQIGSYKSLHGSFRLLNKTSDKLANMPQERALFEEFGGYLDRDVHFQKMILGISDRLAGEDKLLRRMMSLLMHTTRPRPLGAPKIKKALGLIANSVLPGESVADRAAVFKEGFAQFFYSGKVRMGTALLIGAGAVASMDTASFFHWGLEYGADWLRQAGKLASLTFQKATAVVDLNAFYQANIANGMYVYFIKGTASVAAIGVAMAGSLHSIVNSYDFVKHLRSREGVEHIEEVESEMSDLEGASQVSRAGFMAYLREKRGAVGQFFDASRSKAQSLKNDFISYVREGKEQFVQDLASGEMRKIGLTTMIHKGDSSSRILFKTASRWNVLLDGFKSDEDITWEMHYTGKNGVPRYLDLLSLPEYSDQSTDPGAAEQIRLELRTSNAHTITRFFRIIDGDFSLFYGEDGVLHDGVTGEFTGNTFAVKGEFHDANFSVEDERRLLTVLNNIEANRKSLKKVKSELSEGKIESLGKAIKHFMLGFYSWAKSFRLFGLMWNWFFLGRNLVFHPTAAIPLLYYSQFYTRIYKNEHWATDFNGGRDARFRSTRILTKFMSREKARKYLDNLSEFEDRIVDIEKDYINASTQLAFYEIVRRSASNPALHRGIRQGDQVDSSLLPKKDQHLF